MIFWSFWWEILSSQSVSSHVFWFFSIEHYLSHILKPKTSSKVYHIARNLHFNLRFFQKKSFFELNFGMMPILLHGFFHFNVLTVMFPWTQNSQTHVKVFAFWYKLLQKVKFWKISNFGHYWHCDKSWCQRFQKIFFSRCCYPMPRLIKTGRKPM